VSSPLRGEPTNVYSVPLRWLWLCQKYRKIVYWMLRYSMTWPLVYELRTYVTANDLQQSLKLYTTKTAFIVSCIVDKINHSVTVCRNRNDESQTLASLASLTNWTAAYVVAALRRQSLISAITRLDAAPCNNRSRSTPLWSVLPILYPGRQATSRAGLTIVPNVPWHRTLRREWPFAAPRIRK